MSPEDLKALAELELNNLTNHKYYDTLKSIDNTMSNNMNPFDNSFYLSQEDKINNILGEFKVAYGTLRESFEKYMAHRKFRLLVEFESDGQITINGEVIRLKRQPGNETLEDLIKSEMPELHGYLIVLGSYIERAENSIKTCRSHIYNTIDDHGQKPV